MNISQSRDFFVPKPEDLLDFPSSSFGNSTDRFERLLLNSRNQAVQVDEELPDVLHGVNTSAAQFLRDLNLSIEDAKQLDILGILQSCPRKARTKYGKRKFMTDDERVKLTRIRNREHARSTRKRKKIIMEALQAQVVELQRKLEPLLESKLLESNTETLYNSRLSNLLNFFNFRRSNSNRTYDDWMGIAYDCVKVTMPAMPATGKERKKGVPSGAGLVTLIGIDAVIRDAIRFPSCISELLELEGTDKSPLLCNPDIIYTADAEEIVAVGDTLMCNWAMGIMLNFSNGAVAPSLSVTGMAKCRFGFANVRLMTVDLRFDMLGFLRQLESFTGAQLVTKMLQEVKPLTEKETSAAHLSGPELTVLVS